MTLSLSRLVALSLVTSLTGVSAWAENLVFTDSTVVSLPGTKLTAQASSANTCGSAGVCSQTLSFNSLAGGLVTISSASGLAFQGAGSHTGLGVVSPGDRNYSLDDDDETLTLSFSQEVILSGASFFPDDRSTFALTHELDHIDGFTIKVDAGAAREFSFGSEGGQLLSFSTPLVGKVFTFGYADRKSSEDYYLAGLSVAQAVPEPGIYAMLGMGLAGILLARRRLAVS